MTIDSSKLFGYGGEIAQFFEKKFSECPEMIAAIDAMIQASKNTQENKKESDIFQINMINKEHMLHMLDILKSDLYLFDFIHDEFKRNYIENELVYKLIDTKIHNLKQAIKYFEDEKDR